MSVYSVSVFQVSLYECSVGGALRGMIFFFAFYTLHLSHVLHLELVQWTLHNELIFFETFT
jgi:hypothetical protein